MVVLLGWHEQTVTVTGTNATSIVLFKRADQLAALRRRREKIATEDKRFVEAHPLHPVLISMPGVGIRAAARLLTEVSSNDFVTAGHVASSAAVRDPLSSPYYDRNFAQGKRHNQALIALARRRCDVLHAMLRHGTPYHADHQSRDKNIGAPPAVPLRASPLGMNVVRVANTRWAVVG